MTMSPEERMAYRRREDRELSRRTDPFLVISIIPDAHDRFQQLLQEHTPPETPIELFDERRNSFFALFKHLRDLPGLSNF